MNRETALQIAGRIWQDPDMSGKGIDVHLMEEIGDIIYRRYGKSTSGWETLEAAAPSSSRVRRLSSQMVGEVNESPSLRFHATSSNEYRVEYSTHIEPGSEGDR